MVCSLDLAEVSNDVSLAGGSKPRLLNLLWEGGNHIGDVVRYLADKPRHKFESHVVEPY